MTNPPLNAAQPPTEGQFTPVLFAGLCLIITAGALIRLPPAAPSDSGSIQFMEECRSVDDLSPQEPIGDF